MIAKHKKRYAQAALLCLIVGLGFFGFDFYLESKFQANNGTQITTDTLNEVKYILLAIYLFFCCSTFYLIYLFNNYKRRLDDNKTLLRKSELRLRLAFENTPNGNIVSDWDGTIEEFSKSAEAILGYSADEVIGKNVSLLMPEPNKSRHDKYLKNYLNTGVEKIIGTGGRATTARHKDGHKIPIHLCIGTMVIDHQLHFIASITDQTKQTLVEKQLFNFQKMKAIGHLAGGLAHDFNNLLGIAIGNLQLLQRKAELDDYSNKKINTSLQALTRGTKLTKQLLNYTKSQKHKSDSFNINEAIKSIRGLIEQAATKKVTINYSFQENLGSIKADYGDFGDVLLNLTANARDAMPEGGTLFFETTTKDADTLYLDSNNTQNRSEYIQLTVSDTGSGISESQLERIFEPFFTTKAKDKGTGLGLAMVYNFINQSNGLIKVYSEEGMGTSIKLFFPKTQSEQTNKKAPQKQINTKGNETILLVDDEPELLTIAEANLVDNGYRVITATSGEQALEVLNQHDSIDFLLSDIIMPGKYNGFELVIKAIHKYPELKCALTSGFTAKAGEKLIEENLLAKFLARTLLPKPYSSAELLAYIRTELDRQKVVVWDKKYSIGVPAIDNDHRVLVKIINRLYSKINNHEEDKYSKFDLNELVEYTMQHFHREEIVMKASEYPDFINHIKSHHKMEEKINSIMTASKEADEDEYRKLLDYLLDWLVAHIGRVDQDIAPYAKHHQEDIHEALKSDYRNKENT